LLPALPGQPVPQPDRQRRLIQRREREA
jgi:hypothetical protein